jgi:choline kinase
MKVVILAAGKGSRLGQGDLPKPLTPLITGKSILENQLKNLQTCLSLHDILIVVGYHKEQILHQFPDLLYIYNPDFESENTSKSLLRALRKCNDDVLWMNGDVVFHPTVLQAILKKRETSMVVNTGSVGEEEVKYRQNPQGIILEVSKQVNNAQGEALGINYITKEDLPKLVRELEHCAPQDYFEKGIEACIEHGMIVKSIPVDHHHCTEIDFPEDLEKANAMILSWS